jgi:hypothetical protein
MSNSYFDHPASGSRYANFSPLTGDDLNDTFDLVSAGFEKVPSPAELHGGYANYAAATGSTNAYVVALDANVTSLADGLEVRFKANAANTGPATINVNSLGAKSIVRPDGSALQASDIATDQMASCVYDSTNGRFQLASLSTGAASVAVAFSGTAAATVDLLTGATIASSATVNLNAATGNFVHISGTVTITAVTLTRGPRTVIFDGALTLTHHATNNNLPGGINITTAAGDRATYWSDGTTVYCVEYVTASGASIVRASARIVDTTDATKRLAFDVSGVTTGTTRTLTVPDASGTIALLGNSASQAQMEEGTNIYTFATPANVQWHQSAAKAWIKCNSAGAIAASYNVTSITDDGTGQVTVTLATDFSSADYAAVASIESGGNSYFCSTGTHAAGSIRIFAFNHVAGAAQDPATFNLVCFGELV